MSEFSSKLMNDCGWYCLEIYLIPFCFMFVVFTSFWVITSPLMWITCVSLTCLRAAYMFPCLVTSLFSVPWERDLPAFILTACLIETICDLFARPVCQWMTLPTKMVALFRLLHVCTPAKIIASLWLTPAYLRLYCCHLDWSLLPTPFFLDYDTRWTQCCP